LASTLIHFYLTIYLIKEQNPEGELIYYILMQAAEKFYNEYNRYPGANGDLLDSDVNLLKRVLNKLLSDHRIAVEIKEEYIHEM
jgi:amyloid beta precursor protein binding protein 1